MDVTHHQEGATQPLRFDTDDTSEHYHANPMVTPRSLYGMRGNRYAVPEFRLQVCNVGQTKRRCFDVSSVKHPPAESGR
jgi:hypothetical protein